MSATPGYEILPTVVIVDWSGGNDRGPKPKRDAIWAAVKRRGAPVATAYFRNRQVVERWLTGFFADERAAGRQVFAGFDFPFGYPAGFAPTITGTDDPLALWHWIEARLTDGPRTNSRFDLAAEMNRRFSGVGPFWGNGLRRDIPDLPRKKPAHFPLSEWRAVERRAKGAFSCWQLSGAGSVGGQVLTGLPVLARLRRAHDARVWPFEPLDGSVALIEVWPSLLREAVRADKAPVRDEAQVRLLACAVAGLTPAELNAILAVDAPEEGWIFGLAHEGRLLNALDDYRSAPISRTCQ